MKKRVALYVRVSTQEQKKHGLSVDSQITALKEYCTKKKYTVVDVYSDAGISARKKYTKRPGLLRLLNDCEQKKIDLIIFTKLDRWFRSVADYYEVQSILEKSKVPWQAIWEDYETITSQGIFKVNIMLSVAQAEADRTSERIRAVMEFKRKNREYLGGPVPLGYMVKDKKLVKNPETEHIVNDMFDYYFSTFSKYKTADYILQKYPKVAEMNTRGNMQLLISNPIYAGAAYGIAGYCDAYITQEQRRKMQENSNEKVYLSGVKRTYIFSGLLRCSVCGARMGGTMNHGSKSYRCFNRKMKHYTLVRSEKKLEKYLLENLETILSNKIYVLEQAKKDTQNYKIEKKKLLAERDRVNLMFEKGRITEEYYDSRYDEISEKLKELEKKDDVQSEKSEKLKKYFSGNWKELYKQLDEQGKQAFWKNIIEIIIISRETFIEDIIFF